MDLAGVQATRKPTDASQSSFLLRDRILLFDRFAVDQERLEAGYKLDTSESPKESENQTSPSDDRFPGWDHIVSPRKAKARGLYQRCKACGTARRGPFVPSGVATPSQHVPPLNLSNLSSQDQSSFYATERSSSRSSRGASKLQSYSADSLHTNIHRDGPRSARVHSRERRDKQTTEILPPVIPISEDAQYADKLEIHLKNLEFAEKSLEGMIEKALDQNTHTLTRVFQNKLKRQFLSFEFKDRQRNRGFKKELSRILLHKQEKMNGVMQTLCALKTDNSRLRNIESLYTNVKTELKNASRREHILSGQLRKSEEKNAEKFESMRERYVAKIFAVNAKLEKAKHDLAVALNIEVSTERNRKKNDTPVDDGRDDEEEDPEDKIERLESSLDQAGHQLGVIREHFKRTRHDLEALQRDSSAKIGELEGSLHELRQKVENEKSKLTEQIQEAQRSLKELERDRKKDARTISKFGRDLDEERQNNKDLTRELRKTETELRRTQKSFDEEVKKVRDKCASKMFEIQEQVKVMRKLVSCVDSIDEQLSPDLTCRQCLNFMIEPCVLSPCGHSYCRECLQENRDSETREYFCVECDAVCKRQTRLVKNVALDGVVSRHNFWSIQLAGLRRIFAQAVESSIDESVLTNNEKSTQSDATLSKRCNSHKIESEKNESASERVMRTGSNATIGVGGRIPDGAPVKSSGKIQNNSTVSTSKKSDGEISMDIVNVENLNSESKDGVDASVKKSKPLKPFRKSKH